MAVETSSIAGLTRMSIVALRDINIRNLLR